MLTLYDEFAGVGGSSSGAARVPGVRVTLAANHWDVAVESHAANFPDADHYCGDVRAIDMAKFPRADIFWASPACPPWTDARGKRRDFDKQTVQQPSLFGDDPQPDEATRRGRALMEEVPRYLSAMALRGEPVLAGVVENVIQCRLWAEWDRWIAGIEALGYKTRLIAFNSMHASPPRSPRAPQSRDRLYLAYWHVKFGRDPDWDKWLRPTAWCPTCDEWVQALQVFKRPGVDMGRYRAQYVYRCPRVSCRHQVVEPEVLPALAAIDPTIPGGTAIKDRTEPLAPTTVERIKAGIKRWWLPLLTPAGGTWRDVAQPLHWPMPTRTTRESDGVAVPPLVVSVDEEPTQKPPVAGHDGDALHGLRVPFITYPARSGQGQMTTPAAEPLRTVTAGGKQSVLTWANQLLVPYYGNTESSRPATGPFGALTARDRYGIASAGNWELADRDVDDLIGEVLFRMLEPHEIAAAMGFDPHYRVLARSKRHKVRLYGNAVTPPVAELIVSALVEAITGEEIPS